MEKEGTIAETESKLIEDVVSLDADQLAGYSKVRFDFGSFFWLELAKRTTVSLPNFEFAHFCMLPASNP